jgi:Integrase core domain
VHLGQQDPHKQNSPTSKKALSDTVFNAGSAITSSLLSFTALINLVKPILEHVATPIRPGRPAENGFIESFNDGLRDECLNVEWFGSSHQAQERLAQWRDHYNLQRPHRVLKDKTPASVASSYAASATCFTSMERNTANCGPHQGLATPAKNAALAPVPRLPENAKYRGEALFEIENARGSLMSLWSKLQARQSSSESLDRQNL